MRNLVFVALLPLVTGGCLSTVGSVVTAPVKVAGKAVDWTTTSQSEADRNYGKKMRKQEEREGRESKARDKACKKDPANCDQNEGYRAGGTQPRD